MVNQDFWTGDEVYLSSPKGIPVSPNAIFDGVAMYYGSKWALGKNREHITSNADYFYIRPKETGDPQYFYNRGELITGRHYFIHRDQFDRVSFYENYEDALNGRKESRVPLYNLAFDSILLSARGSTNYDNAILSCTATIGRFKNSDIREEVTLTSICDYAPSYERPSAGDADFDNADVRPRRLFDGFPWQYVCLMREWTLNLDAPSVDTTCIAQKFGEAVKSVVSGGGSIDFMVDRVTHGSDTTDPTGLLQLLMLTEKGSKAEAEFWMIQNRPDGSCEGYIAGDLYYKADILVTNIALNVRLDDVIAGSAQFVTTGPIALRLGRLS